MQVGKTVCFQSFLSLPLRDCRAFVSLSVCLSLSVRVCVSMVQDRGIGLQRESDRNGQSKYGNSLSRYLYNVSSVIFNCAPTVLATQVLFLAAFVRVVVCLSVHTEDEHVLFRN